MIFILQIIIFLIIVFIYLHIKFQLKINNNLEIYEIDYDTNENLQKVCDLKLPVIFNVKNIGFVEFPSELTEEQTKMEINVKDNTDNSNVKMSYNAANTLMSSNEKYYSNDNNDFLLKSDLISDFKKNDTFLCPPLIVERDYDLIIGNKNGFIKTQNHTADRKYLFVKNGNIKIIMGVISDDVEKENEKKTLSVNVMEGNVINIPTHWYYKIFFEENTEIMSYTYKSIINIITIKVINFIRKIPFYMK
jgi:hypothetical protein